MPKFIFNHSFYTLEAIIILPTTTLPIPVPSSIPPIPYPERVWKEAGKRVRFVNTWPDLGARNSILKSCTSQTSDGGHSFLYLAPCLWSFICYQTWDRPWVIRGQSGFFFNTAVRNASWIHKASRWNCKPISCFFFITLPCTCIRQASWSLIG